MALKTTNFPFYLLLIPNCFGRNLFTESVASVDLELLYMIQLHKLLQLESLFAAHCHLHIIHGGLTSHNLQSTAPIPTTIMDAASHALLRAAWIPGPPNACQVRTALCRVNILLYFHDDAVVEIKSNRDALQDWTWGTVDYMICCGYTRPTEGVKTFLKDSPTIYSLLVTKFTKSHFLQENNIKKHFHVWFTVGNFGLVFFSKSGLHEVCVASTGRELRIEVMRCKFCERIQTQHFSQLEITPSLWKLAADGDFDTDLAFGTVPNFQHGWKKDVINPFHPRLKGSLLLYDLFRTVFTRANASFSGIPSKTANRAMIRSYVLGELFTDIVVIQDISGFQFITCHMEVKINFWFYTKPFLPSLWIGLLLAIVVIVAVMTAYLKIWKASTPTTFPPWLFIVSTLFEETSSVPRAITKSIFYRLILGLWCLLAINFTCS